jgi:lysophospholipase L1-like esterase
MLTGDWKVETGDRRMAVMMKSRLFFGVILVVGISIGFCGQATAQATTAPSADQTPAPAPQPADVPAPKLTVDGRMNPRFEQLHNSFLARRSEGPIGVLFLGDSITENWNGPGRSVWLKYYAPMDAANFGIGGDQTQHVLWRIANGELDGIDPKVVVLMIGTNNIPGYPQEDVLRADELIVERIHEKLPNARVLVLGIFPRGRNPQDPLTAEMRGKITFVNAGLAKLEDGDKTRFLDIGEKFMQADGTLPPQIMPDGLHPNAAGYQIWADAMNELLGDMMAGKGAQPVGH